MTFRWSPFCFSIHMALCVSSDNSSTIVVVGKKIQFKHHTSAFGTDIVYSGFIKIRYEYLSVHPLKWIGSQLRTWDQNNTNRQILAIVFTQEIGIASGDWLLEVVFYLSMYSQKPRNKLRHVPENAIMNLYLLACNIFFKIMTSKSPC